VDVVNAEGGGGVCALDLKAYCHSLFQDGTTVLRKRTTGIVLEKGAGMKEKVWLDY